MRTAIVACVALLIGLVLGWSMHEEPIPATRFVYRELPAATKPLVKVTAPAAFPERPKPPVEEPKPLSESDISAVASISPIPTPLAGGLPQLPAASPGGPISPMAPSMPVALPTADLNADEALARRVVLAAGGDIVSSSDAKDASGKMGRSLVAEAAKGGRVRIESGLRRSLGDRVILSDGGFVGGSSAEARRAEDTLLALRKKRDQARIDFLPNAPALLDLEDAFQRQERELNALRQASSRQRLNILIRPVPGA